MSHESDDRIIQVMKALDMTYEQALEWVLNNREL